MGPKKKQKNVKPQLSVALLPKKVFIMTSFAIILWPLIKRERKIKINQYHYYCDNDWNTLIPGNKQMIER